MSGVFMATVSCFANSTAAVKNSTAKEIIEAIHSLDYLLSGGFIASSTRKGGKVILINTLSVSNPFYDDIVKGKQDAALRHDYYALVNVQHLNLSTEPIFLNLLNNINLCGAITSNIMD